MWVFFLLKKKKVAYQTFFLNLSFWRILLDFPLLLFIRRLRIEPMSLAVRVQSLTRWTTKEAQVSHLKKKLV